MKVTACFVQCATLILVAVPIWAGNPNPPSELDRQERLRRISEMTFAVTTERLALATNTDEKATILSAALAQELREPSVARKHDSYLTQSEVAQMKYMEMLAALGTNAVPHLKSLSSSASGQTARVLSLALALSGDTESRTRARQLLQEGNDPFIRMMAMRSLDTRDKESVLPLLEKALSDPFYTDAHDSVGNYRIYPVREEAYRTLTRMGVKVTRNGDRFSVEQ